MAMNFFEITPQQQRATGLAEFMTDLTYKIKEDHDLAVQLMRLAEKLSDLDALFGTRWERDFDADEKKLVNSCFALMEKQNASA
tara:strand:+ start:193 stop:444 length:252 start_codon:yes stop_codon:yes gene_type:complete